MTKKPRVYRIPQIPEDLLTIDIQPSLEGDEPGSDLFDLIPNPMIISSLDGRPIYLNEAYTAVFGWTRIDLKGRHVPIVPVGLQKKSSDLSRNTLEATCFKWKQNGRQRKAKFLRWMLWVDLLNMDTAQWVLQLQ